MTLRALLCLVAATTFATSNNVELNCPLVWSKHYAGHVLPEQVVAATPLEYYVTRVYDHSREAYHIGSMETKTGLAYIHDEIYTAYELLTNPHECLIHWVPGSGVFGLLIPSHAWPTGNYGNVTRRTEYVGRALVGANYLAGNVNAINGHISLGDRTMIDLFGNLKGYPTKSKSYEILRSISPGLLFEVEGMEEANERSNLPYFRSDYMGKDEIRNDGDVELVHTVRHSKFVSETKTTTFMISTFIKVVGGVFVDYKRKPKILVDLEIFLNHAAQLSRTKQKVTQKEVVIERQIRVPPRQSVHACSAVELSKKLNEEFKVYGKLTGCGLTGNEVFQVLKSNDPDFEGDILEDSVRTVTRAKVTSKQAVATRFVVVPADSMSGCTILERKSFDDNLQDLQDEKKLQALWRREAEAAVKNEMNAEANIISYSPQKIRDTKYPGAKISKQQFALLKDMLNEAVDGGTIA